MKKNKISKNWVNKQRRDTYVRQSKVDGYRARSAYKLIEIDEKFKIFKGGSSVIDIGAAPGSWSQYALKVIKNGLKWWGVAERQGFEPWKVSPPCRFSRPVHSTALPSLRCLRS